MSSNRAGAVGESRSVLGAEFSTSGELLTTDRLKVKLKASRLSPLSLGALGRDEAALDAFSAKCADAIAHLPDGASFQLVVERTASQGDMPGLVSSIYVFERPDSGKKYSFTGLLSELGIEATQLTQAEYRSLIRRFFGAAEKSDSTIPDFVWEPRSIRTEFGFVKVASLTDPPPATWPRALKALFEMKSPHLSSIKVEIPDRRQVRRSLETKRRVAHSLSIHKTSELRSIESSSTLATTEEQLERITTGSECLTNVSIASFFYGSSLAALECDAAEVVSHIQSESDCGLFVENLGTFPVFQSHLPGAPVLKARSIPFLSGNLGHLLPLVFDYSRRSAPSDLPLVSRTGERCTLNLFSGGNQNFNGFVCGASGSGKSFFMTALMSAFKKEFPKGRIYIFDIGGSYRRMVRHLGGAHFDLDTVAARSLIEGFLSCQWLEPNGFSKTLLENLCGAGPHITHSHRVVMERLLARNSGKRFSIATIYDAAASGDDSIHRDLALWLSPYKSLGEGSKGDTENSLLTDAAQSGILSVDLKHLEGEELLSRLTVLCLLQKFWQELEAQKSPEPSLIVFDEVWSFFSHSQDFLEEKYRTLRKYRGGIVSVTQSLADYGEDNPFARVVIGCSFTKLLLQGAAQGEYLRKMLDLTTTEAAEAVSVRSKKNEYSEIFIHTPEFRQIARLVPSRDLYERANTENIQADTVSGGDE